MREPGTLSATIVQLEAPDWMPLIDAVGLEAADAFDWMYETRLVDGTRVHAYRHHDTRRYLFLSTRARAYVYVPGQLDLAADGYRPVALEVAVERVLAGADSLPRVRLA